MNYGIMLAMFFLVGNAYALDEAEHDATDAEHIVQGSVDEGDTDHQEQSPTHEDVDDTSVENHSTDDSQQKPIEHVMPSAPEEEPQEVPEREEELEPEADEIQGIDTLGLEEPRGNWLFKRIWWERAEGRYDKIRQVVDQMNDVRIMFFAKRTELDKDVFAPFYLDIGFKQGELQAMISELIARLEKERQEEGMLSDQEQELLGQMQEERDMLQKLYRDSNNILLLEEAADKVIERVMEQKNRVARYEKDAWNYMREIARILSDKQARELYYKMDAAWRNIKSIQTYLEQDLQAYFAQLIADAQSQVSHIKEAVQALKEKGFDIKAQVDTSLDRQEDSQADMDEGDQEPVKPQPKKAKGVWGYAQRAMTAVSDALLWLPRKVWSLISGLFGSK